MIRDDRPVRLTVAEIRVLLKAAALADRSKLGPREINALDSATHAIGTVLAAEETS